MKSGTTEDQWHYTYYARDATGEIMAVYEKTYIDPEYVSDPGWLDTAHLTPALPIPYFAPPNDGTYFHTLTRGEKRYELANHLGNVLVTVSDRKLQLTTDEETVSGYTADVWGVNDYYAFGMLMPGRNQRREGYRFGFQGQETDDEVYGAENAVSFKYRVHDARLGRFLSIDPLSPKYPFYSPYVFSGNRVMDAVELEGLEPVYTKDGGIHYKVMKGQGPTQIANDLEANGIFTSWESIVQQNPRYFDHIQQNKWEKSNSAYTQLNMNAGDELYIGTYSVRAAKPVENSGWQEANISGVHIGSMELSGGYGLGASGALFRTEPIRNPNVWEHGRALLMYSAGLQGTTPGGDFNVGVGFMNFHQIKNSSVTESLTDAQSIGISFGGNYGIGGKYLNVTGYLPGQEALPVYAKSPVYSLNMGFLQLGTPGIGGSYSESKFPLNFSHITVQPPIDSQKSAYRLHFRGNVEGTKYLLDHKLDTAKTIK